MKIIFEFSRRDKNNPNFIYERYDDEKKGPVYEFEDEKRAKEILKTKTKATNETIAKEFKGDAKEIKELIKVKKKEDK